MSVCVVLEQCDATGQLLKEITWKRGVCGIFSLHSFWWRAFVSTFGNCVFWKITI